MQITGKYVFSSAQHLEAMSASLSMGVEEATKVADMLMALYDLRDRITLVIKGIQADNAEGDEGDGAAAQAEQFAILDAKQFDMDVEPLSVGLFSSAKSVNPLSLALLRTAGVLV